MAKFRKKPIVIEAEQFHLGQDLPAGVQVVLYDSHSSPPSFIMPKGDLDPSRDANMGFGIQTLEGWHLVTNGDWIITGVEGEKYPCKSGIFAATYEEVSV